MSFDAAEPVIRHQRVVTDDWAEPLCGESVGVLFDDPEEVNCGECIRLRTGG